MITATVLTLAVLLPPLRPIVSLVITGYLLVQGGQFILRSIF